MPIRDQKAFFFYGIILARVRDTDKFYKRIKPYGEGVTSARTFLRNLYRDFSDNPRFLEVCNLDDKTEIEQWFEGVEIWYYPNILEVVDEIWNDSNNELHIGTFSEWSDQTTIYLAVRSSHHFIEEGNDDTQFDLPRDLERWGVKLQAECEKYGLSAKNSSYHLLVNYAYSARFFYGLYAGPKLVKRLMGGMGGPENWGYGEDEGHWYDAEGNFLEEVFYESMINEHGVSYLDNEWESINDPVKIITLNDRSVHAVYLGIRDTFYCPQASISFNLDLDWERWNSLLQDKCKKYGLNWHTPQFYLAFPEDFII